MDLDGAAAAALRETPITRCQFGAVSLFRSGNRWRLSYCVAVSINLNKQQRFDPKLRSRWVAGKLPPFNSCPCSFAPEVLDVRIRLVSAVRFSIGVARGAAASAPK